MYTLFYLANTLVHDLNDVSLSSLYRTPSILGGCNFMMTELLTETSDSTYPIK